MDVFDCIVKKLGVYLLNQLLHHTPSFNSYIFVHNTTFFFATPYLIFTHTLSCLDNKIIIKIEECWLCVVVHGI